MTTQKISGGPLALTALAVFACSVFCCAPHAAAQRPPQAVLELLKASAASGIEGKRLEAAGDFGGALGSYEAGISSADRALDEYNRLGTPFPSRLPLAYWLAAQSNYDAARMKMQLRRGPQEITHHLNRSRDAFTATLNLDRVEAGRSGHQYTGSTWSFLNSRATVSLMLGDFAAARRDYALVANTLNRNFRPAVDALAYLDYMEGRSQSTTTPNGLRLPEKPARKVSKEEQINLVFGFLKLILREYKDELSFGQELFKALTR